MGSNYKTIFIPTTAAKPRTGMKPYMFKVNGDELSRNVQAAIEEMEENEFDLMSTTPITSADTNNRVYTNGVMLIFRKTTS